MRLSSAATVGMLLSVTLALSACGEDGMTATGGPPPSTSSAADGATAPSPTPSRLCRHELGPFVASLAALRDDLARGLSYDDYLAVVRRTRTVYAEIRADRVPAGCLVASGGPAEGAFNLYIDAVNAWGDCLATVSCTTRSIEPRLQRRWALAESRVAIAQRGLGRAR